MTRLKMALAGLVGVLACLGVAAAWLLPDPDREAAALADALGEAAGVSARVAGPVSIEYGWPGTLRVGRIELDQIGWLAEISVQGDNEVTFHLARPQPALLALLASGYSPVYPCHTTAQVQRTAPMRLHLLDRIETPPCIDGGNEERGLTRRPREG